MELTSSKNLLKLTPYTGRFFITFLCIIFIFIFFFFSKSHATRIDTSLEVTKQVLSGEITSFSQKRGEIVANAISYSTTHFIIYYGPQNPATTLWADYNNDGIPDFITNLANILENVWNIEINLMGFKTPKGYLPIPVYIANTGILLNGQELVLSDNICGFSVFDGTQSFIVLNATPPNSYYTKPLDMLKVTVAHEFFHLIQYAYKISFKQIDIWLYEGTATWMENQVYPDINDYIYSYADSIFSSPELGLVYSEGLHPYGTSLFFDFLSNKYGLNIIKCFWEKFPTASNSIEAIDSCLEQFNSTIEKEAFNFYYALHNEKYLFSDGDLLDYFDIYPPTEIDCNQEKTYYMGILGAKYIKNNCGIISVFSYNNSSIYVSENNSVNSGILLNTELPNSLLLYTNNQEFYLDNDTLQDIYISSKFLPYVNLSSGWNLVGFKNYVTTEFLDVPQVETAWKWTGENWKIYVSSYYPQIKTLVEKYGIPTFNSINPGEGIWIKAVSSYTLNYNELALGNFNFELNSTWSLVSFPGVTDINLSNLAKVYPIESIWKWQNGEWYIFVPENSTLNSIVATYNLNTFNYINGTENIGFWLQKK